MFIDVLPLRQRRDDIPLLVNHVLNHFCTRHNRPPKVVGEDAMQVLMSAHWPDNVRQLRNVIERLVVTVNEEAITANNLPAKLNMAASHPSSNQIRSLAEVAESAEKEAILSSLAANDFQREQTAKMLGASVRTLHYKMSRYGLH